jgi:two-component system response regulator HydG
MTARVMIVDDDPDMCAVVEEDLRRRGYEVGTFPSGEAAFDALLREDFDLVLTDLRLQDMDGIELCDRIVANRSEVPVVVITAFGSLETAVAAIRAGAYDFVTKPIEMDILHISLERALRHRQLSERVKTLSDALERTREYEELIGRSPPMERLYDHLDRLATSDASVLITGESGTGKELVARAIHRRSSRCEGPFVGVNCSALPESLLESELFGHVKGAFTDAREVRKGLFLQAEGGTLFLDEIADIPLSLQPKLLRALEERKVRPVGGDREISFDARLVSATNADLETAMEEGRFREDLWFRVNVVQLELPPLRVRGGDILLLAQHYLEHYASRSGKPVTALSKAVAEKLAGYAWPGNVRELRNAIERAVALTRHTELTVEDLPERIRNYRSRDFQVGDDPDELLPMHEVERRYLRHVLNVVDGNKTMAARILGFDRKTLYRKLARDEEKGETA